MDQNEAHRIAEELVRQARERIVVRAAVWLGSDLHPKVSVMINLYTWCAGRFVELNYRQTEGPWSRETESPFVSIYGVTEEEVCQALFFSVLGWGNTAATFPAFTRWASPYPIAVVRVSKEDSKWANLVPWNIRMVLHLMRFHAQVEGLHNQLGGRADFESSLRKKCLAAFLPRFGGFLDENFARMRGTLEL